MPLLEVEDGVSVWYEDWGEGDKFVITSKNYIDYNASYARELSKLGYHVISITLRGYGKSTHLPQTDDIATHWVPDILKVADAVGAKQFVYTGISHGSGPGWEMIKTHPDRILAYAGIVCGPKLIGDAASFSWRKRMSLEEMTPEQYEERCEGARQGALKELRPWQSEYWQDQIRKYGDEEYERNKAADELERKLHFGKQDGVLGFHSEEELQAWMKTIDKPCIIFGGMQDPIVVPDSMFRSVRCVPNLKLVMYNDSDHGVAFSHGEDVIREIDYFLKERKVFAE